MSSQPRPHATRAVHRSVAVRYPLVQPPRLSLGSVAHRTGLHPELVRRFVALGIVEGRRDASGELWLAEDAPASIARAQRLRGGLYLNYAAIGLVLDLLDRIDRLEADLRRTGAARPRSASPGPGQE